LGATIILITLKKGILAFQYLFYKRMDGEATTLSVIISQSSRTTLTTSSKNSLSIKYTATVFFLATLKGNLSVSVEPRKGQTK